MRPTFVLGLTRPGRTLTVFSFRSGPALTRIQLSASPTKRPRAWSAVAALLLSLMLAPTAAFADAQAPATPTAAVAPAQADHHHPGSHADREQSCPGSTGRRDG